MLAEVKLIIIKNTAAQQVGLNSRRTKRGEIEIWGSLRKSYKWWYRKIPVLLWRPPGSFLQEKPAKKSPLSLIFFFFPALPQPVPIFLGKPLPASLFIPQQVWAPLSTSLLLHASCRRQSWGPLPSLKMSSKAKKNPLAPDPHRQRGSTIMFLYFLKRIIFFKILFFLEKYWNAKIVLKMIKF